MAVALEAESPAEVYDRCFVPALFSEWGPVVAAVAEVEPGDRVLDVACGTGTLALTVARLVGAEGSVVGLDPNPEMLAIARRKSEQVEWMEGVAEAMDLPDRSFDAAVSQFGLMFFDDRAQALREMFRLLRPGGRLAVAVCDAVENSPGYSAFARLLDRLFGKEIGAAFRAPFILGDPEQLLEIARTAGIIEARVLREVRKVRFESIEAMVSTERACVWTLGGLLDKDQFERLREESEIALKPFLSPEGALTFDMPALILSARAAT